MAQPDTTNVILFGVGISALALYALTKLNASGASTEESLGPQLPYSDRVGVMTEAFRDGLYSENLITFQQHIDSSAKQPYMLNLKYESGVDTPLTFGARAVASTKNDFGVVKYAPNYADTSVYIPSRRELDQFDPIERQY